MYSAHVFILTCVLSTSNILAKATSIASEPRQASCENTATSRNCWGEYNIDTDYDQTWPTTGVTREVSEIATQ